LALITCGRGEFILLYMLAYAFTVPIASITCKERQHHTMYGVLHLVTADNIVMEMI
jgi:hypothetical protein